MIVELALVRRCTRQEGTKLTASMILERLEKEARSNVGLEITSSPPQQGMSDAAEVSAEGHWGVGGGGGSMHAVVRPPSAGCTAPCHCTREAAL